MYLRKVKISGSKGIKNLITVDLSSDIKNKKFDENVIKFGLPEKYESEVSTNMIGILIGTNSSGKSTVIESIFTGLCVLSGTGNISEDGIRAMLFHVGDIFQVNKVFNISYEFVTGKQSDKILARKYFIDIKVDLVKSRINSEIIRYIDYGINGPGKEQILYDRVGQRVAIKNRLVEEKNVHNIDTLSSVYSIIRSSNLSLNDKLNKIREGHMELFNYLGLITRSKGSELGNVTPKFTPENKYFEHYKAILKIVDNRIDDLILKGGKLYLKMKDYPQKDSLLLFDIMFERVFSEGTRRMVSIIIKIINALEADNRIILVDEIDASLHPDIVSLLLLIIKDNAKSQAFVSMHDPKVLKMPFRKEQISLINKDNNAKTKITRISSLSKSDNDDVDRLYKTGMFGTSPSKNELFDILDRFITK